MLREKILTKKNVVKKKITGKVITASHAEVIQCLNYIDFDADRYHKSRCVLFKWFMSQSGCTKYVLKGWSKLNVDLSRNALNSWKVLLGKVDDEVWSGKSWLLESSSFSCTWFAELNMFLLRIPRNFLKQGMEPQKYIKYFSIKFNQGLVT